MLKWLLVIVIASSVLVGCEQPPAKPQTHRLVFKITYGATGKTWQFNNSISPTWRGDYHNKVWFYVFKDDNGVMQSIPYDQCQTESWWEEIPKDQQ